MARLVLTSIPLDPEPSQLLLMYVLPLINGNRLLQVIAQSMDKKGFVGVICIY